MTAHSAESLVEEAVATSSEGGTAFGELTHKYGERVHLLDNPFLHSALARISSPEANLAAVLPLLRAVYEVLLTHATREFPIVQAEVATRMAEVHPKAGYYRGPVIADTTDVVICDIVRAGMVPSQVCFERLVTILPDERLRLDHLHMSRVTDAAGRVTGVDLSGSKIGGTVEGAILLIPDPMGATGATTIRCVNHYLEHHGRPSKVIALPMIATPEYLRAVQSEVDDLIVYSARLDRGLSDPDILETVPGTYWNREKGLDGRSYIVPGAGGMGEVINNSWC